MIDLSQYPHINSDRNAIQLVNEFHYQTKNPNLSKAERAWFGALLHVFLNHCQTVEDVISSARDAGYSEGLNSAHGYDETA